MSASITRHSAVKRLLLAVAGVAGVGAGAAAATRIDGGRGPSGNDVQTLTLYARDLHAVRAAGRDEAPPAPRAMRAQAAELLDERHALVGRFSGAPLVEGGAQLHTFALTDGAIFGLALPGAGAAHAIIGGTGRYAGAAGTYIARPAGNLPGHSTELSLTLTAREG